MFHEPGGATVLGGLSSGGNIGATLGTGNVPEGTILLQADRLQEFPDVGGRRVTHTPKYEIGYR